MVIESLIREHNVDTRTEAWTKLVLGVLFTLFFSFMIWAIAFFVLLLFAGGRIVVPGSLAITAVFLAATCWSAWKRVDPLAGLDADSLGPRLPVGVGYAIGGSVGGLATGLRRQSLAGAAWFLISGPTSVLEGWKALSRALPSDAGTVSECMELLEECRQGLRTDRVRSPRAYSILATLGMVRIDRDEEGNLLVRPTEKGRAIVAPPPQLPR